MIAKKVRVRGIVQGVFYRESTRQKAQQLGVTGWVRNRLDGSVEAFVQGEPGLVVRMLEWIQHGPSRARVDQVTSEDVSVDSSFTSFERLETV